MAVITNCERRAKKAGEALSSRFEFLWERFRRLLSVVLRDPSQPLSEMTADLGLRCGQNDSCLPDFCLLKFFACFLGLSLHDG